MPFGCVRASLVLGLLVLCGGTAIPDAEAGGGPADARHDLEATFFTGLGADSFAASDLDRYLNPEASGEIRERFVAGIDFEYRLFGRRDLDDPQVWIYGETVHGLRSADVDCQANPTLPVCQPFAPVDPSQATLYILRNATSLEGFAGLRYEFATLRRYGDSPARLYAKLQFGFLTTTGTGDDLIDLHHFGVGLLALGERFSGSHLEIGVGQSDFFLRHRDSRKKIDGFLTWHPRALKKLGMSPFVQYTLDSDFGDGPDSVQTYIGIDYDLDYLFGRTQEATP